MTNALPAALTYSTLGALPANPAQGGWDQGGVKATAMVIVPTATTHQQTANITPTGTQQTL